MKSCGSWDTRLAVPPPCADGPLHNLLSMLDDRLADLEDLDQLLPCGHVDREDSLVLRDVFLEGLCAPERFSLT